MSADPRRPNLAERFFATWRFPVFALTLIGGYEVMLLSLLLMPPGDGQIASFADEFRVWCFGYDPATGGMEWAFIVTTFTSPLVLVAVLVTVWITPLREVFRHRPRATLPYSLAAAVVVLGSTMYLTSFEVAPKNDLAFPAEILRTAIPAPGFSLTNHEGKPVDSSQFAGDVVVVTAVYSQCGLTCPMIMAQVKRVVAILNAKSPEGHRRDLRVIGITLDPTNDTPEMLSNMARGQDVSAPQFHLCTGKPDYVEKLLDRLDFRRTRDPETGIIDHSNMFILIDRRGRIAYRLALGERQEQWLQTALSLLLGEDRTE